MKKDNLPARPGKKASRSIQTIFALAVGAGLGVLTFFRIAPGNIALGITALVGGAVIGRIIAPRPWDRQNPPEKGTRAAIEAGAESKEMFEAALRDGLAKHTALKKESYKIINADVRKEVDAICEVTAKILATIKNDPKDLRPARQFLNYYLDATIKIVTRYVDLSTRGVRSAEIAETLKQVEDSLKTIHRAFERQLELLLQYDVMDLNSELALLKRTIEMEGLGVGPNLSLAKEQE